MFISALQLIQTLEIAGHNILHDPAAKLPHGCTWGTLQIKAPGTIKTHTIHRHRTWTVHDSSLNEDCKAGLGMTFKMYRKIQLSKSVQSS